MVSGRGPDFGDVITGRVADDNDWTASGPRAVVPKRIVRGTVVGIYGNSRTACKVQTDAGEVLCVRIIAGRKR